MSKFYLVVCLIALVITGKAQNRTSTQNGDWNLTSTWGGASVPDQTFGAFGTVTLNHTVTVRASIYTSSSPLQIDQVVINGTGALVIEAGAYMRIQNGTGNDITVNSTGTIVINGTLLTNTGVTYSGLSSSNTSFTSTAVLRASSASIPQASGYNLIPVFLQNVTAALTLDASWSQLTSTTDLTINCPALGNAAISFNGNITQLNSLNIISTNGSNAAGGGRVILAAPAASATNTITITNDLNVSNDSRLFVSNGTAAGFVVLNLGGNFNYNSTSSGTTGFSQMAISAGSATINFSNGNFSMGSGEFRFAASGNNGNAYLNFSGAGSMTVTGGVLSENGGGTAQGTLTFQGSGTSQSLDILTTSIGAGSTINLVVNKSSGSLTVAKNLTVTNTTLTSGNLNLTNGNTYTTTGLTLSSGNFVLNGASVSVLTGAVSATNGVVDATVASSFSIGATGTFAGPILFQDGSVLNNFVVGRAITVQSNPSSGNLSVTNLTLNRALTKSSGTFSISSVATPGLVTVTAGVLTLGSPIIPLGVYDLTYNNAAALTTGDELSSSTSAIRNFTKQGAAAITLNKDLTVNGNFLVSAGTFTSSTFATTLNGTSNQLSSTTTFAALNLNGPLTQSTATATRINGNLTLGTSGSIAFTAGTLTFGGSTTVTNNGGSISLNAVVISGALTAPAGIISIAGNLSGAGTLNSNGGTVVFNGTTAVSGAVRAFNNIIVNNGASLSGGIGFSVLGDLTNNGTINFTGGTLTWNSNGTLSGSPSSTTFSSVTVSSAKTLNLNLAGDVTISGSLTLTGSLAHNTSNNITIGINLAGNGTLNSSGTIIFTGAAANMTGTGAKNFTNLSVTNKLTVGATTSYTLTNGVLNVTGTLTTTASTTGTSNLTIAGNTTIANTGVSTTFNTLTISGTLNATGTINLNRHFTNNGTFNAGGGTISFTNPLATITQSVQGSSPISFANVITSSASSVIFSNAFTIQSSLTLNSGIANNTSGVLTMASSANLIRNGTATLTGLAPAGGPYNITYNGSSYSNGIELLGNVNNVTSNLTGTLSIANPVTTSGTLTVATGVVDCGANAITLGSVNIAGTFTAPSNTILSLTGDFLNNGTFNHNSGTVKFIGSSGNVGGSVSSTFNNLEFGGTGTKFLLVVTAVTGTLSIDAGASLDLGSLTTHNTNYLALAGALQSATGTWGSTLSGASNVNDTFFTSTAGQLQVANGGTMFYSRASGNWNSNSTWSNTGYTGSAAATTPSTGDWVFIGGGNAVTVTASVSTGALSFDNSAVPSVNNTLTISSGVTLTVTGTVTIPQMTSGLNKLDVSSGNISVQNLSFTNGSTGGTGHQFTISSGSATVSGNVTGTGTSSSTVFTGTGVIHIGGTLYSSTQGSLTTFNGSTVDYNGANQTIQTFAYNNLQVSGSGTKTFASNTTVAGNLVIGDNVGLNVGAINLTVSKATTVGGGTSGTLSITSNTGTKTFVGLVTINPGATWTNTNSPVIFRGGITNSGTFTAGTGAHTFNTNAQVLNGTFVIPSIAVTGVTLTNTNTLTVGTALSGSGTLTQAANATLNIGGTSGISNLSASASGNTVNYTGAAQTVHNNVYVNLGLSGSGVKTMQAGTTSINGNLTLSGTVSMTGAAGLTIGGTVNIGMGTTFTSGAFTHRVAGDWITSGSFVAGSGSVNFNGTTQNVTGDTYFNNLQIGSTSSFTAPSGTLGVAGNFTNNSPSFLHNNGTVNFNGATQILSGSINFNNLLINSSVSFTAPSTTLGIAGTFTNNSPSFLHNNGTVLFNGATQSVSTATNFFNLQISSTVSFTAPSGTLGIAGNLTNSSPAFINNGGTVNFNGSNQAVIGAINFNNLLINSSGSFTASSSAMGVAGTFTNNAASFLHNNGTVNFNGATQSVNSAIDFFNLLINSSVSFTAPNALLGIAGDLTNNSPSFVHNSGTVDFKGTSHQSITGSVAVTFNNINVSNTAASVSVESNQNLQGVLTLVSGATFDADGLTNSSSFTLLSLNDAPAQDASIAALPSGASVTGNIVVQRWMTPQPSYRVYRYISAPVTSATVAQLQTSISITGPFTGASTTDPSTGTNVVCGTTLKPSSASMFSWNEATQKNVGFPTTSSAAVLVPGKGYLAFVRNCTTPTLLSMSGPIYNASAAPFNFSSMLSYTNSGSASLIGYNLVGNPFPSAIDWGSASGWTKSGVSPIIAVTGHVNGVEQFVYLDASTGPGKLIASSQSFWVRTTGTGATLTANENVKATGSHQFYRMAQPSQDVVEISLENGIFSDKTYYRLNPNAAPTLDDLDGPKLHNSTINLSTLSSDKMKMAVNTTNALSCNSTIQIDIATPGVDPNTDAPYTTMPDGTYQLNFAMTGLLSTYNLILHDVHLGKSQNLNKNPSYSFVSNAGVVGSNSSSRFYLSLTDKSFTLDNAVTSQLNSCDTEAVTLTVNNPVSGMKYFATIDSKVVSDTVTASTSSVNISIPSKYLSAGTSTVVYQAVGECNTFTLNNTSLVKHDQVYVAKASSVSKCEPGQVTLVATGAPLTGTYRWYGGVTSDKILTTGSTLITDPLTKPVTYYVSAVNSLGCEGERVPVTAYVMRMDPVSVIALSDLATLQSSYTTGNQWYMNGELIEGAVSQTFSPVRSGTYFVKVNQSGCEVTSEAFSFVGTDEGDPSLKAVNYYPNPADGLVKFETKVEVDNSAQVIDNLGKVVGIFKMNSSHDGTFRGVYDFAHHSSGLYFVKLTSSVNGKSVSLKIIRK